MGYHLSKQNGFIEHNGQNIDKIMHNGKCVFSQGFDRESTGTDSVTCEGTIGKDLMDWSIVGDIVQDGIPDVDNPVDIKLVGDKTDNLLDHENIEIGWAYTDNITRSTLNTLPIGTYTLSAEFMLLSRENVDDNSSCGFIIPNVVSNRPTWNKSDVGTIKTVSATIVINSGNVGKIGNVYVYGCGNDTQGKTGITKVSKFMINKGSTSLPYEPWGYRINVVSRGKNLCPAINTNNFSVTSVRCAVEISDDTFIATGRPNESSIDTAYAITSNNNIFLKSGYYFLSFDAYSDSTRPTVQSSNTTSSVWQTGLRNTKTLTTYGEYSKVFTPNEWTRLSFKILIPEDNEYAIKIATDYPNLNIGEKLIVKNIQLERDVLTSYEPYKTPITTPIYLKTPLAKNEVLRSNGDRNLYFGIKTLTGTEDFKEQQVGTIKQYYLNVSSGINVNPDTLIGFCTHLKYDINLQGYGFRFGGDRWNGNVIFMTNFPSLTDFVNFVKQEYNNGSPVIVYYPLNISTTETVDVPQILTFRNEEKTILGTTTIITTDTEVKPSQIDASYKSNKIEYVTLTDDNGNVTKMRKSDYDDLKTDELLDILEVM